MYAKAWPLKGHLLKPVPPKGEGLYPAEWKEIFGDIPWQLDTFHGVVHRLGGWNKQFYIQNNHFIKFSVYLPDASPMAQGY